MCCWDRRLLTSSDAIVLHCAAASGSSSRSNFVLREGVLCRVNVALPKKSQRNPRPPPQRCDTGYLIGASRGRSQPQGLRACPSVVSRSALTARLKSLAKPEIPTSMKLKAGCPSRKGRKDNMRIHAKGLHWTPVTLADGTKKIYWYAWRGGPRLVGEYGSPDFIPGYNPPIPARTPAPQGPLPAVLQGYQRSQDFLSLRERTRADYLVQIKKIEQRFGEASLKGLSDPRTRGIILEWRDELALRSKRQADYAWQVLARILSWAKDRGKIMVHPCGRGGRVYSGTRVDFVWSVEDEVAFLERAPTQLHLPLLLGLWTGQRQGDLLRLPWSAYDGAVI